MDEQVAVPGDGHVPARRRGSPLAATAVLALTAVIGLAAAGWLLFGRADGAAGTSWANPVGDVRTADACALVDSDELQRFGATRPRPQTTSPTNCAVVVRPPTGERLWVGVTLSEPWPDDGDLATWPRQSAGEITIYHVGQAENLCQRILLTPDRTRLVVATNGDPGRSGVDLCTVTEAVQARVLAALHGPPLPRRPVVGPPNSLLWQDPCALADDAAFRAVPGLDAARVNRNQGGWFCIWGGDPARADPAELRISIGTLPSVAGNATVAGRPARTTGEIWMGTREFCQVAVTHRPYRDEYGEPRTEALFVGVHLTVATPTDAQCAAANAVAQAVVTKLPAPN